ncbi:Biogenesis of lysosome-related organelles complex 1 subunit 3 [Frankliniella fusca]|uniref:Biogenesis of lysosome-related organelles complex 1 subunit 3 n=1 Tax=Frankliniella fusca TaxID=407009 RepID=A0AAE1I3R1_9NEOP|nr:Biogenesis of lysosome-related organelles complex 1 subunit 3 [Frankliniella fusca]
MEGKLNIVPGEAPESDDEEAGGEPHITGLQGTAIMGEAPESSSSEAEDVDGCERGKVTQVSALNIEFQNVLKQSKQRIPHYSNFCSQILVFTTAVGSVGSVSSAASAFSLLSPLKESLPSVSKEDAKYGSLLHKKLRERNSSLRRSVEDFIHSSVGTAARDLNSIDQHLLKSQVTLQEAATSLRILQSNLSHIHSKLSSITSSTYLPSINVDALKMMTGISDHND